MNKEVLIQKRKELSKKGQRYGFGGGSLCFIAVILNETTNLLIVSAILGTIGVLLVVKAVFILFDYEKVRKQIKELK